MILANGGAATRRIRVLHINSGNIYGGVETVLVTLARYASSCADMESCFALCFRGRLSQELTALGARLYELGEVRISRPWTVARARRKLRSLLHREHFDLVICHMPWSLAVLGPAVRDAGQKLGFWAHCFHLGRNWLERLAGFTIPDLAISNSGYTERGLANLFRNVRAEIIYPPFATVALRDAAEWRTRIRQQLGAAENTVVITQVSRLEALKGHNLHLQALARLPETQPWACWIVGGPQHETEEQYLSDLTKTVRDLGLESRVRFLGQRADVPRILAASDIFCQPNAGGEGFGMVFVEALWTGLPVVSTRIGGATEIVDDTCGFLVESGNAARLAEVLEGLIESPELRGRLGSAGPARALELCDPAGQLRRLDALVRETAGLTSGNQGRG